MADTTSTPSSSRPWRVAHTSAGSIEAARLIQPHRLDVLVHFLAFEQLAGTQRTTGTEVSSGLDWLALSEALTEADHEVGVVALAAELLTSSETVLEVSYGSGGHLVSGAAAAAASLYSGRPITRLEASGRVVDRSFTALSGNAESFDHSLELLCAWGRLDPSASVVLIDLDASGADALEHELTCRYPVIMSTVDHVSAELSEQLGFARSASVRLICVRADEPIFTQVMETHRAAVIAARRGSEVLRPLMTMLAPDRERSTSPTHQQLVRRVRRAELRLQLLARIRGR